MCFNTQPPEGGWGQGKEIKPPIHIVSTHSRPKAAGAKQETAEDYRRVSTHSRPKAAGADIYQAAAEDESFNTQPPEGGWALSAGSLPCSQTGFNTQPPEGGWSPM